jgi:hypothetical protein
MSRALEGVLADGVAMEHQHEYAVVEDVGLAGCRAASEVALVQPDDLA